MTRRMWRLAQLVVWIVATLCLEEAACASVVCPTTNEPPPSVITMMRSTDSPTDTAWIVTPDCDVTTIVAKDRLLSWDQWVPLDYVASLPSGIKQLWLAVPILELGGDFSGAPDLEEVFLTGLTAETSRKIIYPPKVQTLVFAGTAFEPDDEFPIPSSVTALYLEYNNLKSLKKVPAQLKEFGITMNLLTSIDFEMPDGLEKLVITLNPIESLENVTLPSALKEFDAEDCGITRVRGIKWPVNISSILVEMNPIVEFEIRHSDIDVIRNLDSLGYYPDGSPACSDETANVTVITRETNKLIRNTSFCVISDERFDAKYKATKATPVPTITSLPGPLPTQVDTGTREPSESPPPVTSTPETEGGAVVTLPTSQGSKTRTTPVVAEDGSVSSSEPVPSTRSPSSITNGSASSSTATVVAIASASVVVALVAAMVGLRHLKSLRQSSETDDLSKYDAVESPSSTLYESTSTDAMTSQMRVDATLLKYRLDFDAVQLDEEVGSSTLGVMFHGVYDTRAVFVRRFKFELLQSNEVQARIRDEMKLWGSLEHPKILELIGITWSNSGDLSVVSELMAGGNLYTGLRQDPVSTSSGKIALWTHNRTKWKLSIAVGVVEALVYLHSCDPPIVHGALTTQNVLLDLKGNVKLGGFGGKQRLLVHERSTCDQVLWTSPEVLRGEPPTEASDMYSLGGLLVELDRFNKLAERGVMEGTDMATVSSRSVELSLDCLPLVRDLIDSCLSPEPERRPSAMQVHFELRRELKNQ